MTRILFLLLISMLFGVSYAQQQPVFHYNNGKIIANTMFIELPENKSWTDITPYELRKEMTVSKGSNKCTVKLSKYKNWEQEPGDYNVIEIKNKKHVLFNLSNDEGWTFFKTHQNIKRNSNVPFMKIDLKKGCKALLFTGITIMNQPPLLTIIIINKKTATLVYNKPTCINNIRGTDDATKLDLQLNVVEYAGNVPYGEPQLATMTFKDGMIYYHDKTNPEEYDLKEIETRF